MQKSRIPDSNNSTLFVLFTPRVGHYYLNVLKLCFERKVDDESTVSLFYVHVLNFEIHRLGKTGENVSQ